MSVGCVRLTGSDRLDRIYRRSMWIVLKSVQECTKIRELRELYDICLG